MDADDTREERGFKYRVGETEVHVRNRPTRIIMSLDPPEASAYLSVTDSWVSPATGVTHMWFPWNEGRQPTGEMFYATNRVLDFWIRRQKMKRVDIFCDGGTHRSVTVFGAFLKTYYTESEAQAIVDARSDLSGDNNHCNPLEYVSRYMDDLPSLALLFRCMRRDQMSRLDVIAEAMTREVTELYGDWKYRK